MLWLNHPCSYYDCKMQLRNNYQETLEKNNKGSLLIGPGNYVADLGPHSEVGGRERERVQGPGVFLLWSRVGA